MRPNLRTTFRLIVPLVLCAPALSAQISGGGSPNGGIGNDIFNDTRSAAAFSVAPSGGAFDDIRFWAIIPGSSAYSPTMFWQILSDVGGSPDNASVALSGSATAAASNGGPLAGVPGYSTWQLDLDVGAQSLGAGIFWLALHDGAPDPSGATTTTPDLIWETADGGTPYQSESISAGTGWAEFGTTTLAFELRDSSAPIATPEPAPIGLVALGLIALIGVSHRRTSNRRRNQSLAHAR